MADEHVQPDDTGKGSTDQAPKTVTEEQLNKAITSRLRAFEKKTEEQLQSITANFQEAIKAAIVETAAAKQDPPAAGRQAETPELAGLRKQMAEAEKNLRQITQERDEERKRLKDNELRTKVQDELSKYGVVNVRHAVAFLVDAEKRVSWSDDGSSLVFRDSDGDVDLATGVKSWVQTDDGKIYLPARGTTGTGGRKPPQQAAKPTEGMTRADLAQALWEQVHKA